MKRSTPSSLLKSALAALALALVFTPVPSSGKNEFVSCQESQGTPASIVRCELRLSDPLQVQRVTASPELQTRFRPNESLTPPTPVIFLLNQSTRISDGEFNRLKSIVSRMLDADIKSVSFGLHVFSNEARIIAPLGTAANTTKLALATVGQQGGTNELLRGILSTLPTFATSNAPRKILIILSAGQPDDQAYSPAEISKRAKDAGITVFTVSPRKDVLQELRRIAEETTGGFFAAPDTRSSDQALRVLTNHLSRGGFVEFSPGPGETRIEAQLSDNKTASFVYIAGRVLQQQPPPQDSLVQAVLAWLDESWINKVLFAVGLLAVAALLWTAFRFVRRRRHQAREQDIVAQGMAGQTIGDLKPALARFEFLDAAGSSEPIHLSSTRIGRHKDNDIILTNTSVHRHHAILKQDKGGPFVIIDMDTENGVFVNGDRVKTAKLKDGDLVELGEVRMRFRAS